MVKEMVWDRVALNVLLQEMTQQPAKLSKKDLKFLMSLLDKAEGEADDMIEMDSDNKRVASLRRRQIMRIRLVLIDLHRSREISKP
jgi:hypothetical protein